MFTGIIESLGKVVSIEDEGTNRHFELEAPFITEIKIDQSIAHNGVCLTVTEVKGSTYLVTAIDETLKKTALGKLSINDEVNLERCMKADGRFDGHIVQGHVDEVAVCTQKENKDGSWLFTFEYDEVSGNITVEKGSITVNGISLTVVDSKKASFSVAIIPYTYEHTNLKNLEEGSVVNLEFDILGKYIQKIHAFKC